MEGYVIHPALLDACLHITLHRNITQEYSKDVYYMPSKVEQFTLYHRRSVSGNLFSHIQLQEWTPGLTTSPVNDGYKKLTLHYT